MTASDRAPWPSGIPLSSQESIPPEAVERALEVMESGRLHRYGEGDGEPSEASRLEADFARELGVRYCVAMNSCGSTLFVALRAMGVGHGDRVLANCFTLAPVPGAIAHTGAEAVLVDSLGDYTIDLDDLAGKARDSGASVLLLSHMRGHICDMEKLDAVCAELGVRVVEDCAHTMGASWNGRPSGTWGQIGCFSLQSYKHANAGEGGLLVTDDEDIAAQAILLSGAYMFYDTHVARPESAVFERWKYRTPNFSLRLSNVSAAITRPQLGHVLRQRVRRWNDRYEWLRGALTDIPHVRIPARDPREQFVGSSIQFSIDGLDSGAIERFINACAARGLPVKWFGAGQPQGYTSIWEHWRFVEREQSLPNAERLLSGLCDLRIPLGLTEADCQAIGGLVRDEMQRVAGD